MYKLFFFCTFFCGNVWPEIRCQKRCSRESFLESGHLLGRTGSYLPGQYVAQAAAASPCSWLPTAPQHSPSIPTNMRCPPRHLGGPYYTHLRLDPCHVKWVCLVTLSSRNNFLIIFKKLAWMVAHLLVVCLLHIMVSPYPIVQLLAQNACSKRVTIRCTFLNFPAMQYSLQQEEEEHHHHPLSSL